MILSLDPSTAATGWALWAGGKLVTSGVFNPPRSLLKAEKANADDLVFELFMKRFNYIQQALETLILSHAISKVIIEDQFLGRSVRSMKVLVEFRTAIESICIQNGVSIVRVMPSVWQSFVFKYRVSAKQTKQESVSHVARLYAHDCTHDESDAILIGHWYLNK